MHRAVILGAVAATFCCAQQTADRMAENTTVVDAWSLTLIEQTRGPANSDALTIDLLVQDESGERRPLATGLVGPLIVLPVARKIFSCESNSTLATISPILIHLTGTTTALPPHPGYLRNCTAVGTGEEVLLHYSVVDAGVVHNVVHVIDATGGILVEQRLDGEGEVQFEAAGQVYRIGIPAPQLPG